MVRDFASTSPIARTKVHPRIAALQLRITRGQPLAIAHRESLEALLMPPSFHDVMDCQNHLWILRVAK